MRTGRRKLAEVSEKVCKLLKVLEGVDKLLLGTEKTLSWNGFGSPGWTNDLPVKFGDRNLVARFSRFDACFLCLLVLVVGVNFLTDRGKFPFTLYFGCGLTDWHSDC